jgi:hypothetical protein
VSTFDGQTIGDIDYTKVTTQRRSASGTMTMSYDKEITVTENQRIFPAYTIGDSLTIGILAGPAYIDLNTDGRLWVRETNVFIDPDVS